MVDLAGAKYGADLAKEVAQLDVLVLPSVREESETFGMVLAEAALAGVPRVAMGLGGPLDAVDHGAGGGLLVPFVSPLLLALQLQAVVGHSALGSGVIRSHALAKGLGSRDMGARFAAFVRCLARCPPMGSDGRDGVYGLLQRVGAKHVLDGKPSPTVARVCESGDLAAGASTSDRAIACAGRCAEHVPVVSTA